MITELRTVIVTSDEVWSINMDKTIPFAWIIMDDGSQLNLPINVLEMLILKYKKEFGNFDNILGVN